MTSRNFDKKFFRPEDGSVAQFTQGDWANSNFSEETEAEDDFFGFCEDEDATLIQQDDASLLDSFPYLDKEQQKTVMNLVQLLLKQTPTRS